MKSDFDEFSFKDEINLMSLQSKMEKQQIENTFKFGFNEDSIYNKMEDK